MFTQVEIVLLHLKVMVMIVKFNDVSCDFVYNQVCKMDNNKSTGLDQFSVKLLKLAAPYVIRITCLYL